MKLCGLIFRGIIDGIIYILNTMRRLTYIYVPSAKNQWKEGNILFNDALNTFYFTVIWRRTYGKGPLR